MSMDNAKAVYLFVHGRMDLMQKSVDALLTKGFSKENIFPASPTKVGQIGEYMAMLWMPPNPDHIKIQKITKVEAVEPQGMIGLWKGVSKEDITTIPL